ncbi:superoxide dismutase family protein [Bacillus sp. BRMEA1]|uniref:superoxide dismutase family protein n=1 Tax=Neobacillus endophyticus TaxID=2738405 RepID=UPI00156511DC|nr:superoxide dismutase family protein [Neobacillus endophyticus]NRD76380.1 superoxide dismutase family protein [Neobacillus endophyticus]
MKKSWILIPLLLLSGCMKADITHMNVKMIDAKGKALGTIQLAEQARGVKLSVDLKGLPPGVHALHIHEKGKCMAPSFKAAGKHLNPEDKKHGLLNPAGAHAGDLPNLTVDDEGAVKVDVMAPNVTMKEGEMNTLLTKDGTALILTTKKDDGMSQPDGHSGKGIACGEISKNNQK